MFKFLLILNLSTGYIIRNRELPICINCLHFIEDKIYYPYDQIPCDEQYGRCKKFGQVNLISGAIKYDLARDCRFDVSKCGNSGSEYIENPRHQPSDQKE